MRLKRLVQNITGYWIHKRRYLPVGVDLFADLQNIFQVKEFDVVFDVGANEGQSIQLFNENLRCRKIYSFEPVGSTYKILSDKFKDSKNSQIENLALSNSTGTESINISQYSGLNSLKNIDSKYFTGKTEKITLQTLDNYVKENSIPQIDFLKIDTEGFELEVLKGAAETIKKGKIRFIYCEIGYGSYNNVHTDMNDIRQFLEPYGYRFVALYDMSYKIFKKDHSGNVLYYRYED